MSIGVLVLSILFAAIETLVSWLMLEFPATAAALSGLPLWLITAIVFALGMFISFVVIIIVGSLGITDKAADFVRDNFGRTLVLMLASVVIIFGLSSGAEALYQMKWEASRMGDTADLCFVLDFSLSMDSSNNDGSGTRLDSLKAAFVDVVEDMKEDQRISIVGFAGVGDGVTLLDWTKIDDQTRSDVIDAIQHQDLLGNSTCYGEALQIADGLIKSAEQGRPTAVVMLSDGEDMSGFELSDMDQLAREILAKGIHIYTIGLGDGDSDDFAMLEQISSKTGGEFVASSSNMTSFVENFGIVTEQAGGDGKVTADTLLTAGDPNHKVIFDFSNGRAVLRILLLFLVSFVFKLIVNICIGNNASNVGVHVLTALVVALLGSLVVEFGYLLGLPLLVVEFIFWLLLMGQIVLTDR